MNHVKLLQTLQTFTKTQPKQREIADALGVKLGAISTRASRNSEYNLGEILKIGEYFNITQEDMMKKLIEDFIKDNGFSISDDTNIIDFQDKKKYVDKLANEYASKKISLIKTQETVDIDYYPDVFGSCGTGTFVLSQQKEKISVPKRYIEDFSSLKQYSIIKAYGDSMMPYIQDRDELIVEHYNNEQIKDNRVYVFRLGDKFFIKRLVLNINQVVIKSDNTMYEPVIIKGSDLEDFQIIGKIVGLFRRMG